MNDQIDKLLHKAGAQFGAEGILYDTFVPREFAKLVVLECIRIVAATKNEAIDLQYNVDTAMTLAESDIARAFGVKR